MYLIFKKRYFWFNSCLQVLSPNDLLKIYNLWLIPKSNINQFLNVAFHPAKQEIKLWCPIPYLM